MRYNNYLVNSPQISEIGFGGWRLGKSLAWSSISDSESIELVHKALEMGVNFFDTAPNYGKGESERLLGEALKEWDRTKIVITTKFGHTVDGKFNYDPSNIRTSLEGSLKRLKTDYVDSLLIHSPDKKYLNGNYNDHYHILEELKKEGKILAYGASLENSSDINEFINTTDAEVVEAFFNIIHQDSKNAFKKAKEKGVKIIAKIPLDSGWLTGKYNSKSTFSGVRDRWSKEEIETRAMFVEQIKSILYESDNLSQAAIAFCLAFEEVTTVIPGNKNISQLLSNIESSNYLLTQEIISLLEDFYDRKIKNNNVPW